MNLSNAPYEQLLKITAIFDNDLENELRRSGLRVGDECHKHLPASLPSLRLKIDKKSVVLGGGLTRKILISCGGTEKCLDEIRFKDEAVISAVKGGKMLQNSLQRLGVYPEKKLRLMRRLPPMEYVLRLNNRSRIKISESTAARVIGRHEDSDPLQLSAARVELDFSITEIIGGRKFAAFLKELGLKCGEKIVLEGVEHVSELFSGDTSEDNEDDICLKTRKGAARIHLSSEKASYVEVTTV